MAKASYNAEFQQRICKALGLDPSSVQTIVLTMDSRYGSNLKVTQFIEKSQYDGIVEIMKEYHLNPLEIK